MYGESYPDHVKCLHLFNVSNNHDICRIETICEKFDIIVVREKSYFYILSFSDSENIKYKIGIDDVGIDVLLEQYRTVLPDLKLIHVVYTKESGKIFL